IKKAKEAEYRIPDLAQRTIAIIHNHVGSICQTAYVVTHIFFAYLGKKESIVSLAILSIGYLRRQQMFSSSVNHLYDKALYKVMPLCVSLDILKQDMVGKIFSIFHLCSYAVDFWTKQPIPVPYSEELHGMHKLTAKLFSQIENKDK